MSKLLEDRSWFVVSLWIILMAAAGGHAGAQIDAIFVDTSGNVGIGTSSPAAQVHVLSSAGAAKLLVEELAGGSFEELMELHNQDGDVGFRLRNPSGAADFNKVGSEFRVNIGASPAELFLTSDGDLTIRGSLTTQDPPGTFPDFVFKPGHQLMPLDELRRFVDENRHLPGVMSAGDVAEAGGVNMSRLQLQLLAKVEELTLYVLEQNEMIESSRETIRALRERVVALEQNQ